MINKRNKEESWGREGCPHRFFGFRPQNLYVGAPMFKFQQTHKKKVFAGTYGWGMTLTELLVSTALIGIVMLGVVSVEYASKRSQENMSRKSIVTTRTSAMLLHIVKNAALAVGDVIDVGIRIRTTGGINSRYACFRQDIPQTPE